MSSIVRPGLEQIDGSGAAIGDSVFWDGDVWAPGPPNAGTLKTGEVLMADGVTSPPVPLETEAGDDWLYQD